MIMIMTQCTRFHSTLFLFYFISMLDRLRHWLQRQPHRIHESKLEHFLYSKICDPIARILPQRLITPNHITLLNVAIAWSSFLAVAWAQFIQEQEGLEGNSSVMRLRCIAAGLIVVHVVLDSLDGTYARYSKQTSDIGEILDHGLDAMNVQLISAGLVIAMGFEWWVAAVTQMMSSYIYNAQIVLYRVHGKMVNPPTNGVDAEFGGIGLHLFAAWYLYHFGKDWYWNVFQISLAIFANATQFYDWMFLLTHFPPKEQNFQLHMSLVGASIPFGLLLAFQFINPFIYTIIYCVICLKFTGLVVLYTVVEKKISSTLKRTDTFLREQARLKIFAWFLFFLFWSCWLFPSVITLAMFVAIAFSCYYPIIILLEGFKTIQLMRDGKKQSTN
jgi:phosphatidylglycerophosphate synthase